MRNDEERSRLQRSTYYLFAIIGLSIAAGRIAVVTSREGDTAFLSANDRSRWCTIAAIIEDRSYAIDRQISIRTAKGRRPWYTIDMVRHRGNDGKLHYYSSKPPLLPTMIAGVYGAVHLASGMTLSQQPIYVTRIVLALVNLPLLAIFYLATIFSIDKVIRDQWARRVSAAAVCFGTMLLPFAISINNHLPAAAATAIVMWIYLCAAERLDESSEVSPSKVSLWWWACAGLAAAFVAANELPALSMLVFWLGLFAMLDRQSVVPFAAGAAVVALAFFGTNWLAHQSLRPPYAHRGNGALIAELGTGETQPGPAAISDALSASGLGGDVTLQIQPSDEPDRLVVQTSDDRLFGILRSDESGWTLNHWDDWYEYPNSYWQQGRRRGVDLGEPSRLAYFFQITFGHHGIFSLTPIWMLAAIGLMTGLSDGPRDRRRLVFAVLVATLVCILFYLARPLIDRNYGGVSVCFRWLLWFAPLWLLASAPVMDRFSRSGTGRWVIVSMLAASIFSVATSLQTPWQSPWLYRLWSFLGWISG